MAKNQWNLAHFRTRNKDSFESKLSLSLVWYDLGTTTTTTKIVNMAGSSLRTSPCSRTRTREPMWMSTITSRRALGRSRGLHSGENYLSLSTWYFWRCRIKNSLKIICFSQFLQSTHFRYGTTWCVSLSRTCQPICHHRSVIYNKSSLVSSLMPPQVA